MIHQNRTLVKLTNGWARNVRPQELTGLQFYSQRKSGEGENNFFLSRLHASIISSSRLSRGVLWSLCGQARSTNDWFLLFRELVLGLMNSLSSRVGCGAQGNLVLLFGGTTRASVGGFVVKQACFAFLSNH